MTYSREVIEEIRSGNDIVDVISSHVQLKQSGASLKGLCPFHKEKTPSFHVFPAGQNYHCFGCGASGNVFGFVMQKENHNFPDAVKILAERIHYAIPEDSFSPELQRQTQLKEKVIEINTAAARWFYEQLNGGQGKIAADYLDKRGITLQARKKFGLGFAGSERGGLTEHLNKTYDYDLLIESGLTLRDARGNYYDRFRNRLMFPIFDYRGKIIAFGGRIMGDGDIKYLNSPDSPAFKKGSVAYGINFVRESKEKELILVEGYMDVISLYQAGFKNVSAALGTALTNEHAKLIKKYSQSVTILFDSDEAGEKAALKAIPILIENGLRASVLQVENAKDPDEYIKKFGSDGFSKLLKEKKLNHILFQINCVKKKYDISVTDDKVAFIMEASKLLSGIESSVEREAYAKDMALITGLSEKSVIEEIGKHIDRKNISAAQKANRPLYVSGTQNFSGVDEARRHLLYAVATDRRLADAIFSVITEDELKESVYKRFYQYCFELYNEKNHVFQAEVLNYFETSEEQKIVSGIFHNRVETEERADLLVSLNHQIWLVKKVFLEEKKSEARDIAEIQAFGEELHLLNKQKGYQYLRNI